MTTGKSTKGQTTIYKKLHKSLRFIETNYTKIRGELMCSENICSSSSTGGIRRVTIVTNPIMHVCKS